MRLHEFIVANPEPILAEFEEFARSHTAPGETMDIRSLRDHAAEMLNAIAKDMVQPQTASDQKKKSKGEEPGGRKSGTTAAEQHGADRAGSGFTLAEMFSEYRALRASVLRLWTDGHNRADEEDLGDLIRFNEAIDQALAESITEYSTGISHSREMFLAILGHDLRTPLGAVLTASDFLVTEGNLTEANLAMASRIRSSGKRMLALVSDLLDFTRSRLGKGIPITRTSTDIAATIREAVEEIGAQHPDREFHFSADGELDGQWDGRRISQAVANLVGNAVQHGTPGTPIVIRAHGQPDEAIIALQNRGLIDGDDLRTIFDPFERGKSGEEPRQEQGSLGLGLYIAHQIALAHGGRIDVESSKENGTTFRLHLPRSV